MPRQVGGVWHDLEKGTEDDMFSFRCIESEIIMTVIVGEIQLEESDLKGKGRIENDILKFSAWVKLINEAVKYSNKN